MGWEGLIIMKRYYEMRIEMNSCFMSFLSRNQGENTCTVIYEDGEFLDSDIPQDIMDKFIKYGIDDPYIWRHN